MNIDENLLPLEESRKTRMSNLRRESTFIQDPKASFYFAIYACNQFIIGTMISAFTPIQESLTLAYQVKKQNVIMSSSVFLVGNVLSSLFVYPVCVKIGLTWTIRLALIVAFLGCLLRMLIAEGFIFVLIGQTLLGISAGFQVNTTMQFCYNWFSPSRRPIYMSIVSVSNIFGGGLGALLPILFVDSKERQIDVIKHQIQIYIQTFAILFFVLTGINMLFFKGKPDNNYGAQEDDEDEDEDELPQKFEVIEGFKQMLECFKYPIFNSFLILFILANAALVTLGAIANIVVLDFGFTTVIQQGRWQCNSYSCYCIWFNKFNILFIKIYLIQKLIIILIFLYTVYVYQQVYLHVHQHYFVYNFKQKLYILYL